MNKQEAYDLGKQYGESAAYHTDLPEGCDKDTAIEWAYEAEMGARDFSPWEFVAHRINTQKPEMRVDGLWASYESGVSRGIILGLKARGI